MVNYYSFPFYKIESQYINISDNQASSKNVHKLQQKSVFIDLINNKSYIPLTKCIFDYIITCHNLSSLEKLYYLIVESLSSINSSTGKQRAAALSASKWAAKLGCSKSQVFAMQKKLAGQEYFIIEKDKNSNSQDKRNLIIPTVPNSVFEILRNTPDRAGIDKNLSHNPTSESRLAYLYRTKLFIPLNYKLLALISSNESLNPIQKIIWLDFYTRCYRTYVSSDNKTDFSFFTTYHEMMQLYGLTKPALSKLINRLVRENFILKKQIFRKSETGLNERQDKSIWQITLSLPMVLALHLSATKDRKSINVIDRHMVNSADTGINLETGSKVICRQSEEEQGRGKFIDTLPDKPEKAEDYRYTGKTDRHPAQEDSTFRNIQSSEDKNTNSSGIHGVISCTDPHVANSSPYINKNILLKNSKSNLERKNPKVTFNDFSKKFKRQKPTKQKKDIEFNICSELIRQKLKSLPKDKADKARKFAYSLISRKLTKGYATELSKHELAKQIIFHAASWKPTEYSHLSKEDCIDIALAVAWKAIINGTWQAPLGWVKAQTIQYEFEYYRQKYQETGVLSSYEITGLEGAVSSLLGSDYHCVLVYEITHSKKYHSNDGISDTRTCRHCRKYGPEVQENMDNASYQPLNMSGDISGNGTAKSIDYSNTFLIGEDGLEEEHCYSEENIVTRTDFSILPDEQRLCVLTTSDEDNSMILETAAKKQYLVKAKALETNSYGEMIIVLQTNPALISNGSNMDDCIDKTLSNIALGTTGTSNVLADNSMFNNANELIQKQESNDEGKGEYLPGGVSCNSSFVVHGDSSKAQALTSYNCNSADFIDYAKLLDEE